MPMDENVNRSVTELRIMITEDAQGNLDVEWGANIKGTEIAVPLRASHVAGQLYAASFIVLAKSYEGLLGKINSALKAPSNLKEEKKRKNG